MSNIECDCSMVGVNQNLQSAFLYASFAFWCVFITRPFRPGISWLSRSTWIILASLDAFILLTWEAVDSKTGAQMIAIGIMLAISCFFTYLIELINEGDRQRAAAETKKRQIEAEKSSSMAAQSL